MKIWFLGLLGALALAGVFGWLFWRRNAQAAAIERLQVPQTTTVAVATIRPVALASPYCTSMPPPCARAWPPPAPPCTKPSSMPAASS